MTGNLSQYTNLITSQYQDKPNYLAMLAATCQPFADILAAQGDIAAAYDLDQAIGSQLDVIGQWVGVSRKLLQPLVGVYFSLDTLGLGFDQGVWQGPYDPTLGLVSLPDNLYLLVIKAKILNNHWDGSVPSAYRLMNQLFAPFGYTFFIQDPADMTMQFGLVGDGPPNDVVKALLTSGVFNVKPAGVYLSQYIYQSAPGPMFALDMNTSNFAGFDSGSWATMIPN